jgi:hypothetical protein
MDDSTLRRGAQLPKDLKTLTGVPDTVKLAVQIEAIKQ